MSSEEKKASGMGGQAQGDAQSKKESCRLD